MLVMNPDMQRGHLLKGTHSLYIMLSHWTVHLSSKPLKNVEGSSAIESKSDSK